MAVVLATTASFPGWLVINLVWRQAHDGRLSMKDAPIFEGGCLCGAIRYRASSAPMRGVLCHCSMCRKHSGAPVLAFVHFRGDDFAWIRGAPARYRSSAFAERGFCSLCGSTISMHEDVLPDRVQVTVGSLDEPQRARIDDHVWTQEELPWFHVDDRLPRFRRSSNAVPSKAANGAGEA